MILDLFNFMVALGTVVLIYYIVSPWRSLYQRKHPLEQTQYYIDPLAPKRKLKFARYPFSSITDAPELYLSVIIPTCNDSKIIVAALQTVLTYLALRRSQDPLFTFEIIVVDDGSDDDTCRIVAEFTKNASSFFEISSNKDMNLVNLSNDTTTNVYNHYASIQILKLDSTLGKGGAIQQGVLHSRGSLILYADPYGTVQFSALADLENTLELSPSIISPLQNIQNNGTFKSQPALVQSTVAIGSRGGLYHGKYSRYSSNSAFSSFMNLYIALMKFISGTTRIYDSQCDFKLFTRAAALSLFGNQRMFGESFDIEIMYLASRLGIPIVEIPIPWNEIPASTLQRCISSINLLRDLVIVRFSYAFSLWKIYSISELLANFKQNTWETVLR